MYVHPENQYLNALGMILEEGEEVSNRTEVSTYRLLGMNMRFDFKDGFPLLTTKKVWFKGIVHELLWFLQGNTNIKYLIDNGVNIWNDDCWKYLKRTWRKDVEGQAFEDTEVADQAKWLQLVKSSNAPQFLTELGPVYGAQWRRWGIGYRDLCGNEETIDQIARLIDGLNSNPYSRRHILSSWNVADLDQMALPPCHLLSQFSVTEDKKLWCQLYQRSADMFLGVPFNIASYSLLTYMLAQVTGLTPGGFIWTGHDCHIYTSHTKAVLEQIQRKPKPFSSLNLNTSITSIDDFKYEDIKIENYQYHEVIKASLVT